MTTTCAICDKPVSGTDQFGPLRAPVCAGCWAHWTWSEDLEAWIPEDWGLAPEKTIRRPYCTVMGREMAGEWWA